MFTGSCRDLGPEAPYKNAYDVAYEIYPLCCFLDSCEWPLGEIEPKAEPRGP